MATRESSLWTWFSKPFGIAPLDKDLDHQRVENGVTGGTPDVEVCFRGLSLWIELKVAEARKSPGRWFVKYQPLQIPWHKRRAAKGGISFVLIRAGSNHYVILGEDAGKTEGNVHEDDLRALSIVKPDCDQIGILTACLSAARSLP